MEAKFPDSKQFVRPEDPYCERREYWHVNGYKRTLLAVDCAEQWGPDSQGPIRIEVAGRNLKLSYIEWQYDNDCEKAIAFVDAATAKVVSCDGRGWEMQVGRIVDA